MLDYNKRLVEVSVILNHLKKSDYDKIPKEIIEKIEKNKDKEYSWNYDETKDLKNQNVSNDTIAILSYLNMQYLLNQEQKEFMQGIFNENQIEADNIKREKYNPDNIFNNKVKNQELIKHKKYNFIQKIFLKIKRLLKIK